MKRNNKTYGQIKEEVKEAEAVKQDFAKISNMEYHSKHNMTGEQKFYLLTTFIICATVMGFFALLTGAFS